MGTSGSSSGSGSETPLVPSWLDEPGLDPLPGEDGWQPPSDGSDRDGREDAQQNGPESGTKSPQPVPAEKERFRSARNNFSRFARSGGSDGRALRRAVRDYVRTGTGGTANAVRRMAPSRAAAGRALSIFRALQRDGIQETLRRINLQNLSGHSVQEIFVGLTEVVCRDGGSIDEAIARDAWLETIAELDQFGIDDPDALTDDQVLELFLSFVAHSIEARLYQEIGVNGFKLSDDLDDIESFDGQFRDYIGRAVRDSFSGDMSTLSNMSDYDIRNVVDSTYLEAWGLLQLLGDREG
ncbi:MAG: hypothetical protein F4X40_08365 [Chloroflexi bacterium]|nr:hypothetical protein [Chloroflexota bacterium]